MTIDDYDEHGAGPDDHEDAVFVEADRLYQHVYDEVYEDPYAERYGPVELASGESRPRPFTWTWWNTRPGRVIALVSTVIGFVLLAALARGIEQLAGPTVVRITATPEAPTAPVMNPWPGGVDYVPHTIPAIIKNEITAVGQQHGYRFEGDAGDTWRITVEPQSDTFDPLATLYGPSGEVVGTNDDRAAQDWTSELTVRLPESGSYALLVESSAGGVTVGPYLLSLFAE